MPDPIFKSPGVPLFKSAGVPAHGPDCCCCVDYPAPVPVIQPCEKFDVTECDVREVDDIPPIVPKAAAELTVAGLTGGLAVINGVYAIACDDGVIVNTPDYFDAGGGTCPNNFSRDRRATFRATHGSFVFRLTFEILAYNGFPSLKTWVFSIEWEPVFTKKFYWRTNSCAPTINSACDNIDGLTEESTREVDSWGLSQPWSVSNPDFCGDDDPRDGTYTLVVQ